MPLLYQKNKNVQKAGETIPRRPQERPQKQAQNYLNVVMFEKHFRKVCTQKTKQLSIQVQVH